MRSSLIRVLAVLSILLVPAFAFANVTINGTANFASLDGGPDDADHLANGVFTVNGDLTVNGTINCNDDGAGANSACAMQFVVSGNLVLNAGSAIFAENRTKAGNGGDITFTVGGDVIIHGPSGSLAGAIVSSAKTNDGNPAHGGDITFNGGGTFTQESGSTVSSAAQNSQRRGDLDHERRTGNARRVHSGRPVPDDLHLHDLYGPGDDRRRLTSGGRRDHDQGVDAQRAGSGRERVRDHRLSKRRHPQRRRRHAGRL